MNTPPSNEKKHWLDQPGNVDRIIRWVKITCGIVFAADILFLLDVWDKHAHFHPENLPGFYALVGFVSYCTIVLTAKQLRKVLKRDEDYYDR
ncbi:MAG: hypothetical protein KDM81_19950 [Verrucomicrobiae bacterium]|nr:hypothetical protein [Verrucomicrobiae bacterium]